MHAPIQTSFSHFELGITNASSKLQGLPLPPAVVSPTEASALAMKVAESRTEREQAFRLTQQMYARTGLTDGNAPDIRVMRHHLADTTEVLIAKKQQDVVFTVSLVGDGEYGLPMESLFGEHLWRMRNEGVRMAEVSCLASCGDDIDKRERFDTLVNMISLLIQVARRRGIERLLLAVHPKHAKIYERLFGCVRCSDVREYAAVQGNPAVLCMHDFAELDEKRYPLYDKIYGPSYAPWQLDGPRMTDAEKKYFKDFVPSGESKFVPMAA